jgi:hypothetical protein
LGSIANFFSGLSSATSAAKIIQSLLKDTRGTRRAILLELKKNMDLLFLFLDDESKYRSVINKLETRAYTSANEGGFDFNTIKKGKVSKRILGEVKQLQPYAGWTTEELFENIYLRINQLKNIIEIAPESRKFRLNVRLKNLHKMMVLLIKHIKT